MALPLSLLVSWVLKPAYYKSDVRLKYHNGLGEWNAKAYTRTIYRYSLYKSEQEIAQDRHPVTTTISTTATRATTRHDRSTREYNATRPYA